MMKKKKVFDIRDAVLDAISEGVFTVGPDWRIVLFNKAAARITGIRAEAAVGRPCRAILRADACERDCPLKRAFDTGEPVLEREITIVDSEGNRRLLSVSASRIIDDKGRVVGGVESFRDLSQVQELRRQVSSSWSLGDLVSRNQRMHQIFDILPPIAESSSTVLLQGESGTGKELVARAVHDLSPRRDGPFVAVNCSALPDNLLESELFGYEAGAFTDARKDKPGRVDAARGGTLFLDEIGDLSVPLQVKLLRFLQERTYEPLGSTKSRRADVRVVAATNRDLSRAVDEGRFRRDLFYRINVVTISLPPLRERLEDIPLLVDAFIRRFNAINGKAVKGIDNQALALLMGHSWPGNVRELENVIERAFIFCGNSSLILARHLPSSILSQGDGTLRQGTDRPLSMAQLEAAFLTAALERNGWNRASTAKELGIHKTTLYRKMKSLGIVVPSRSKSSKNAS